MKNVSGLCDSLLYILESPIYISGQFELKYINDYDLEMIHWINVDGGSRVYSVSTKWKKYNEHYYVVQSTRFIENMRTAFSFIKSKGSWKINRNKMFCSHELSYSKKLCNYFNKIDGPIINRLKNRRYKRVNLKNDFMLDNSRLGIEFNRSNNELLIINGLSEKHGVWMRGALYELKGIRSDYNNNRLFLNTPIENNELSRKSVAQLNSYFKRLNSMELLYDSISNLYDYFRPFYDRVSNFH